MRLRMVLLLLLAVAAGVPAQSADGPVVSRGPGRYEVEMPGDGVRAGAVRLALTDGRTGEALPIEPAGAVASEWDATYEAAAADPGVALRVALSNRRDEAAWVGLAVHVDISADEPLTVWNGEVEGPGEQGFEVAGPRGIFPTICAWTAHGGVALSWPPDTWYSYVRHAWTPTGPNAGTMTVALRPVLEPGERQTFAFRLTAMPGEYGFRHALAEYYRRYPEWFVPTPGVDPRVWGNGATYNAWTSRARPENCRRLRAGWEWCYAPFVRTGDIYVHEELSDYQPARPMSAGRRRPAAEYRHARAQKMLNGRPTNVAMMFYIPSAVWCEEQLARQRYPDAIVTDSTVTTRFTTPWVTGHDNELRMFPGAEPYRTVFREDMAKVLAETDLAGFAFDTAEGGARWMHPLAASYPHGRAWDQDGVYVDEGVGIAELMDFVHSLRAQGRVAAVASNPTSRPSYLTPFRSDVLMIEGTPWGRHGGRPPEELRWFAGHKTLVWWEDWLIEREIDWQVMTPEEIRAAYRGVGDYAILESLRIGCLPTPRMALGSPKVVRWTQVIADLITRHWRAVPAIRGLDTLDKVRYGYGPTTAVGLGNKTAATVRGAAALQNAYVGDAWDWVLTAYDGGVLDQKLGGRLTTFDVTLPSREAAVWVARLGVLAGSTAKLRARLERARPMATLTVEIDGPGGDTRILPSPLAGFDLAAVEVNGSSVKGDEAGAFTARLRGRDTIIVRYRSQTFDQGFPAVAAFPLAPEDRQPAAVAYRGAELRPPAEMVADFINRAVTARGEPDPRVSPTTAPPADGPVVVLEITPGADRARRVSVDGRRLLVCGRDVDQVWRAVSAWLAAVEDRYPYYGVFVRSPAADRAGLTGKCLEP